MAYFNKSFLKFFKELSRNNDRDWFNANKEVYLKEVKEPFDVFIGDLIAEMRKKDQKINLEVKDAVFRIYRDVRFSKNKEPYKLHAAAVVSPIGRRDHTVPGLYIMLSAEKMMVGGGAYRPDKDQIYNIREAIAKDPRTFNKIVSKTSFVKTFDQIQGDKNKIIPKEFKDTAEIAPLIYNKQWYYMSDQPANTILDDQLIKRVMEIHEVARPMREFLENAMR